MKLTPKVKAWVDQLTWEELVHHVVTNSYRPETRGEAGSYLVARWWKLKQERRRNEQGRNPSSS